MARNVLDYRPMQNNVESLSVVHVERAASGGVRVRVAYPPGKFRQALIGTAIAFCVVAAFPVAMFCVFWKALPADSRFLLLLPVVPWAGLILFLIRWVSRLRQSYIFQADGDGVTIQSYRGRREWCERLPREQITDVRIGFGSSRRSGQSTAWLIIAIKPWYQFNRRLLHDLGGDHLARVADALRAGIGLPPRSWP
jgi:hypothetical protein